MTIRLAFALGTALLASACFEPPVECGPNGKCRRSSNNIDEDDASTADAGVDGSISDSSTPDDTEAGADATGSILCYRDEDGDGVGFGAPIPCAESTDAQPIAHSTDDCDDLDPDRTPGAAEVCDAIDNDCDLDVDDDALNFCGGPCTALLAHTPGDACNNGQLGVCARSGTWECINGSAIACNAATIPPGGELCGDSKDNDCDGQTDEPDATNVSRWYRDCDGDGYAGTTANFKTSCTKPANDGTCTWTTKEPNPSAKINWDCDDTRTAYAPGQGFGYPPAAATSWDLNCDGRNEPSTVMRQGANSPCSNAIANMYNGLTSKDCSSVSIFGCSLWRDAGGTYFTTPQTACPDVPIRIFYNPATSDGCGYDASAVNAAYPCR